MASSLSVLKMLTIALGFNSLVTVVYTCSPRINEKFSHCRTRWIEEEFKALTRALESRFYGQHIAQDLVQRHMRAHLLDDSPKKALVMSFHGTTGSGKNFLTQLLEENLMHKGMKSPYIKYWSAKHHFSNKNKLDHYQELVSSTVLGMLKRCSRSLFIIDEANELPPGLLDVLTPMMEERAFIEGQDCTRAIFIFLSNTGSLKINELVKTFKNAGKHRTDIKISDFHDIIQTGAFNENGGFLRCDLIKKNIINLYVPFLPLEKEQVVKCIEYYFNSRQCPFTQQLMDDLTEMVVYDDSKLFAVYGCRGIDDIIKNEVDNDCVLNPPKMEL